MNRISDLIAGRRTVRSFKPDAIPRAFLERMAETARLAPSAANLQPLEFVLIDDPGVRADIFPCLKWAAYIVPAGNPAPGHEPAAYIVALVNTKIREKMFEYDVGAAMENMIVAAMGEGIGSCWLLSIDRERIREILKVPADGYRIDSVLALGYPDESPLVEELAESCKYWKDENGVLHVPKRKSADVIHLNRY
jgi:nitroreductase